MSRKRSPRRTTNTSRSGATFVTCISLKRRSDRRQQIRRNVVPHFPKLEFFNAVDKQHPETIPRGILERVRVMPRAGADAKHGKAACIASHLAVLQRAIRRNLFPHIVIEDDVRVVARRVRIPSLPRNAITLLGGHLNPVRLSDVRRFHTSGIAQRLSNTLRPGVVRIDKSRYRISSAAAYFVPSADVAREFLEGLERKRSLTHFDIEMHDSPMVTHILFPSPFESDMSTARASDIINSQSIFFTSRYTRHPNQNDKHSTQR